MKAAQARDQGPNLWYGELSEKDDQEGRAIHSYVILRLRAAFSSPTNLGGSEVHAKLEMRDALAHRLLQ